MFHCLAITTQRYRCLREVSSNTRFCKHHRALWNTHQIVGNIRPHPTWRISIRSTTPIIHSLLHYLSPAHAYRFLRACFPHVIRWRTLSLARFIELAHIDMELALDLWDHERRYHTREFGFHQIRAVFELQSVPLCERVFHEHCVISLDEVLRHQNIALCQWAFSKRHPVYWMISYDVNDAVWFLLNVDPTTIRRMDLVWAFMNRAYTVHLATQASTHPLFFPQELIERKWNNTHDS